MMGKDFVRGSARGSVFFGCASALAFAALLWGCGDMADDGTPDDVADEEPVAATSEALTTLARYTDPTGTITVTYYVCGWSAVGSRPRATCTVPSADALVGGGVEIEGDNPDAMVFGSYPADTRTWVAESTTLVSANHRVRARAMGLRLSGVSAAALRNQTVITSQQSTLSFDSFAFAGSPMLGTVLAGGGGRVSSGSHLMYDSSLNIPCMFCEHNGWVARAKAHPYFPEAGRVTAYGIWLPECPSGFAGGCLVSRFGASSVTSPDGGYISHRDALPRSPSDITSNLVLTSLGGWIHSPDGAGRYLSQLYPYWSPSAAAPAGRVASTDHLIADPGILTAIFLVGLGVAE